MILCYGYLAEFPSGSGVSSHLFLFIGAVKHVYVKP